MLEALSADVVACRACEVAGHLARANPIRPTLIEDPRVMLIGQAPGPVTDRKGYHFAGPAGRFLEIWFDRAGFPGKSPSGNGDRPPSRAEIALCRQFLEREFELIQPRVVLLVGKMAIDAFLGKHPLTDTVGQVFEVEGRLIVPLPHASGVSRWLNTEENRARLDRALAELGRLRAELSL